MVPVRATAASLVAGCDCCRRRVLSVDCCVRGSRRACAALPLPKPQALAWLLLLLLLLLLRLLLLALLLTCQGCLPVVRQLSVA